MDRFHEILEKEFEKLVNQKNSWGKNEIMIAFHKAFAIAVAKYATSIGVDLT